MALVSSLGLEFTGLYFVALARPHSSLGLHLTGLINRTMQFLWQ